MTDDNVQVTTTVEDDPATKTRTATIVAQHFPPEAKWHDKEKLAGLERESEKKWTEMEDETRQALVLLVIDILNRMAEDPDVWIPTSMVPRTGNRLDLWVGINFDEVDDEVIKRRLEAEKQLMDTRDDLSKLEKELADGNKPKVNYGEEIDNVMATLSATQIRVIDDTVASIMATLPTGTSVFPIRLGVAQAFIGGRTEYAARGRVDDEGVDVAFVAAVEAEKAEALDAGDAQGVHEAELLIEDAENR